MRVRNEHWSYFVNYAEINPGIIRNTFCGVGGKTNLKNLWEEVTAGLNGLGYGEKSVSEWRKAVIDWKSKTKTKASQIQADMKKTGGGPVLNKRLTELEERLLKLVGQKSVHGDVGVEELGFQFKENKLIQKPVSTKAVQIQETVETIGEKTNNLNENVLPFHIVEQDHESYCANKGNNNTSRSSRKLKRTVSDKLVEMNRETVNILHSLNTNLNNVATALNDISVTLHEIKEVVLHK